MDLYNKKFPSAGTNLRRRLHPHIIQRSIGSLMEVVSWCNEVSTFDSMLAQFVYSMCALSALHRQTLAEAKGCKESAPQEFIP